MGMAVGSEKTILIYPNLQKVEQSSLLKPLASVIAM
jgi:hypothetical protein